MQTIMHTHRLTARRCCLNLSSTPRPAVSLSQARSLTLSLSCSLASVRASESFSHTLFAPSSFLSHTVLACSVALSLSFCLSSLVILLHLFFALALSSMLSLLLPAADTLLRARACSHARALSVSLSLSCS